MDQHVPHAITVGLRLREIDVITAFEDGASEMNDSALLNRTGESTISSFLLPSFRVSQILAFYYSLPAISYIL